MTLLYSLFIVSFIFCSNVEGSLDYDAPSEIKIFHSIDESQKWFENGQIVLQNINTGSAIITQPSVDSLSGLLKKIMNETEALYRLKFIVRTSKGRELTFYSFSKLSTILKSGVMSITMSLDQNGSIIGLKASPSEVRKTNHNNAPFSVALHFKVIEVGPVPDTASYILKLEREREAKERGATQDNRSFLAKYWMYLVPVVLFAFLSGTTNTDGGGGGAAR